MGVNTDYMVGAYLVIESDDIVEQTPAMGCPNHAEELFVIDAITKDKIMFCKKCGKKYEPKMITETHKPTFWRLLEDREDLEDMITDTHMYEYDDGVNTIIAISNESNDNKQPTMKDLEYAGMIEITPQTISEYIKNFETKFKNVIDYLKTKTKSIEIKFGAILYYS